MRDQQDLYRYVKALEERIEALEEKTNVEKKGKPDVAKQKPPWIREGYENKQAWLEDTDGP